MDEKICICEEGHEFCISCSWEYRNRGRIMDPGDREYKYFWNPEESLILKKLLQIKPLAKEIAGNQATKTRNTALGKQILQIIQEAENKFLDQKRTQLNETK